MHRSEERNTPKLETGRLILRRFSEADAEAVFCIYSDREVNQYLPWFPLETREQAEEKLREYQKSYQASWGHRYAVCLKEDNVPVGYVHVSNHESNDFGYGLRKEFWNRGIITEASMAVVSALKAAGLPYITATHDRNNPASGAVMKKLGMKYCYSYEEQWQPKDIAVIFRMYQLNLDGEEDRVYMEYWNKYTRHFVEPELA